MKKLIAFLLLALVALVFVGVRSSWLQVGFRGDRLTQLERDWAEVVDWAQLPEFDHVAARPLEDIAIEWRSWARAHEIGDVLVARGDAEHPRVARADLPAEVASMQERFELLLTAGLVAPPRSTEELSGSVMLLGKLVLQSNDLDRERMRQLLEFARRLQLESDLHTFNAGCALAREALARCREDNSLLPTESVAPAPRPSDLFDALCRDFVLQQRMVVATLAEETVESDALEPVGSADEFLEHATQRALANAARLYYPLRDEPERFGEIPAPTSVGATKVWFASTFRLPGPTTEVMESMLWRDLGTRGERWAELVSDWDATLN